MFQITLLAVIIAFAMFYVAGQHTVLENHEFLVDVVTAWALFLFFRRADVLAYYRRVPKNVTK